MRLALRFTGRVQGVGFRATTRSIARQHPVSGWVRNEADGSVTAQVQGSHLAVEMFVEELVERMDSFFAHVDRSPIEDEAGETGFEIRR